jgi:cytosine/adenosine deaminase-related metal-dependent hydrolase
MTRTLLRDGVDGTRRPLDVLVDNVSTTTIVAAGAALGASSGGAVLDCSGMTLLPAPAEPHAHLAEFVAVVGDLNDTPNSQPLTPRVRETELRDVSQHDVRWRAHRHLPHRT